MTRVFLGGSCGATRWRKEVAIPRLDAAGLEWFDPQEAQGGWSAAEHEARDMREKARADVLLFVVDGSTRGVASLAEISHLLAAGRPLALAVVDVPEGAHIDGRLIDEGERADLNRGRLFVRTMAKEHGVATFSDVAAAVDHAISLGQARAPLDLAALGGILSEVECGDLRFVAVAEEGALYLLVERGEQCGRRWLIDPRATPGEVVQTALKAVLTWQEHETRETFHYRGARVFSPHLEMDALVGLDRSRR